MATPSGLSSTEFDIDDSPEAVFQFMLDQGWSDGLPVIPPTTERVRAMLDYAQRDASELVGYINPDAGSATVEKIAVNAVMAGCLPEYMPVLIAAVEAITEPSFNIHGLQTTTNPVSPLLIINGPVREQIGLNSGRGTLGPGYRANATIGRAVQLVVRNVGGGKPGGVEKRRQVDQSARRLDQRRDAIGVVAGQAEYRLGPANGVAGKAVTEVPRAAGALRRVGRLGDQVREADRRRERRAEMIGRLVIEMIGEPCGWSSAAGVGPPVGNQAGRFGRAALGQAL